LAQGALGGCPDVMRRFDCYLTLVLARDPACRDRPAGVVECAQVGRFHSSRTRDHEEAELCAHHGAKLDGNGLTSARMVWPDGQAKSIAVMPFATAPVEPGSIRGSHVLLAEANAHLRRDTVTAASTLHPYLARENKVDAGALIAFLCTYSYLSDVAAP
jgi:hypothetical protein